MTPIVQNKLSSQRAAIDLPYLIHITHPEYGEFRFVNAKQNVTYNGEVYVSGNFSIQPPARDGSKVGNASLTISAVDQTWIEKIRGTQIPALIEFIAVVIYDNGEISGIEALEENSFILRNANWDDTTIQWEMVFDEVMSIIITSVKCTPLICPGCS